VRPSGGTARAEFIIGGFPGARLSGGPLLGRASQPRPRKVDVPRALARAARRRPIGQLQRPPQSPPRGRPRRSPVRPLRLAQTRPTPAHLRQLGEPRPGRNRHEYA
jgi:hypothetical protein